MHFGEQLIHTSYCNIYKYCVCINIACDIYFNARESIIMFYLIRFHYEKKCGKYFVVCFKWWVATQYLSQDKRQHSLRQITSRFCYFFPVWTCFSSRVQSSSFFMEQSVCREFHHFYFFFFFFFPQNICRITCFKSGKKRWDSRCMLECTPQPSKKYCTVVSSTAAWL